MQQLIKITSVPMRTMSYTQNARLISSDSVDLERRKALARQMSFHRNAGKNGMPMQDLAKINRTFSRRSVSSSQGQNVSRYQSALHRTQQSVPHAASQPDSIPVAMTADSIAAATDTAYTDVAASVVAAATSTTTSGSSIDVSSSYALERGSLEMKVAKGDLTFLPPMVMTIVTQYPELHFEYLGDFNYVPPREASVGGNINLFT